MIVTVPAFTPTSLPPEAFTYLVLELLRLMAEAAPSLTMPTRVSLVSPTISFMVDLFSARLVGAFFTFTRQLAVAPLWAVMNTSALPARRAVISPVAAFTVRMLSSADL